LSLQQLAHRLHQHGFDLGGGAQSAVIATLAALRRAERTGVGGHCDVSMLDGMLSWMSPHIAAAQAGSPAAPSAMLLNGAHPCYHVYRCADGWITVAALEPKFWTRLREQLGVEDACCEPVLTIAELLDDPQVRHRAQDVDGSPVWFPFRVGAQPHAPAGPAPGYGADSRALLAELGVGDAEWAQLVSDRVTA